MAEGYEYRVAWKREGLRSSSEIRQTEAGARAKAARLRGDFYAEVGGLHGSIVMPGGEWLASQGVPDLERLRIERRRVGEWEAVDG